MHIPTHGMSVTGQIYSLVSLFPEWNIFGHWDYLGAAQFTVALSYVLGWHQRICTFLFLWLQCKVLPYSDELHMSRFSKVERLVGYCCKGAHVNHLCLSHETSLAHFRIHPPAKRGKNILEAHAVKTF